MRIESALGRVLVHLGAIGADLRLAAALVRYAFGPRPLAVRAPLDRRASRTAQAARTKE